MKYTYSAVFMPTEDGTEFYAKIPDLPGCVTTGDNLSDAIAEITDAAAAWLVVAEDKDIPIPAPTPQEALAHASGAVFSVIQVDTVRYRAMTDTRAVRKNVSLPAWMADMAEKAGLSFSQVLQDGLKGRLGVQ